MMNTQVWLIGAGPGDPDLLTLKAVKALERANVVLVDDLVNPDILDFCPQARIVRVGKRGGCRSTPQEFIQRLMLRYARQGLRVARLKGGDPCIFGRGGEEAQWLSDRGVACEVINGITSGLAAATAVGIPLTLRGVAMGVTLVTARAQDGSTPDWSALARSNTTLVIYMGVANLPDMQAQLLAAGMAVDTPVAMIERACLPEQRECASTLTQMAHDAAAFQLASPAILVIGKVADHRMFVGAASMADASADLTQRRRA